VRSTFIWIIRSPQNLSVVEKEIPNRFQNVRYRIQSHLEDAPSVADCLTATAYFYKHAYQTPLPLYYIGDMPRMLVKRHSWQCLYNRTLLVREGDLVFLKARRYRRLVAHVAWVSAGRFHHVNQNGYHSHSIHELFEEYQQPYFDGALIKYIDRRNVLCRYLYDGIFVE